MNSEEYFTPKSSSFGKEVSIFSIDTHSLSHTHYGEKKQYLGMGNAFGNQKTIKEITRENQRMINKAIRELDREIKNLEKEQKKFEVEIKKAGKKNEIKAARLIAKDIVRSRANISRFMEMRSTLNGVSMKLLTIKSHDAMSSAMKGVTKAMTKMNKMNDVPALQKLMADFMRENEKSDMTQEVIADTLDDAFDEEGALEEEELIVNQVHMFKHDVTMYLDVTHQCIITCISVRRFWMSWGSISEDFKMLP